MKKILYITLAVCLVLMLAACGGGNTSNGIKSDHKHCVCAGKAVNVGEHTSCAKNDGWQKVSTAEELTAAIKASSLDKPAYVVLTADIAVDAYLQVAQSKAVNICLNGKTLTASARVLGKLNVTDCTGNGTFVSDKNVTIRTYSGAAVNVYAGTITTTGAKGDTQVVVLRGAADTDMGLEESPSVFTFYGGKIKAVGKTTNLGHCVYIDISGILKMYNGTICDGYVETSDSTTRYGGNVAVWGSSGEFHMYGGEVKNGTAIFTGEGKNASAGLGGNIYVYRGSLFVAGGTISGGRTNGYGGNIGTNNKPRVMDFRNCVIKDGVAEGSNGGNLYINGAGEHLAFTNVTISGGKATSQGANVFLNAATAVSFVDCTITDGVCASGGAGIAVQGKEFSVEMSGNMKFGNNKGSDILMLYYTGGKQSYLSVEKLTSTDPIVVGCKKMMVFTVDTVANHPFVAVEGMSITEVDGKLVIDKN